MEQTTARLIADALRQDLFTEHSSDPTRNAQRNLGNRTHYVDPATLKYHKSRIRGASPVLEGAFFRIMESVATVYDGSKRGFRVVLFDLCGATVYRPDLDECNRTADGAMTDYWAWLAKFNPTAYYRETIITRTLSLTAQVAQLRDAAAKL